MTFYVDRLYTFLMLSLLDKYLASHPKKNSAVIAYLAALDHLQEKEPQVAAQILKELADQRSSLKLIASENFSSLTVQLAMGNLLTDKYCEGFPHHRFYAGCENVDVIEQDAVERAKKLFKADHAYVQPHSGADANLVAFWAILIERIQNKEVEKLQKKNLDALSAQEYERIRGLLCNQKMMGLSLSSGGHLTHGFRQNLSSKMMQAVPYDVDPKTSLLDYDRIAKQAREEKPLILLAGYSAYPRLIDFAKMRAIADEVGAVFMVDMAHFAGLVAGGVFKGNYNPIEYAHIVTSTTHKTLRGPRGGLVLCKEEFKEAINKGCPYVLGGPLPHVMAAKSIAFNEASTADFSRYSHKIVENAKALGEALLKEGFTLVTGGTDNHLLLIDLSSFGLTGRHAETALRAGGITANRNMVPFDPKGAWYTSGLRIGTAALTTLGMGVHEMQEIAKMIAKILKATQPAIVEKTGTISLAVGKTDEQVLLEIRQRVKDLLQRFPLYPELVI